jgi:hypothetical protein
MAYRLLSFLSFLFWSVPYGMLTCPYRQAGFVSGFSEDMGADGVAGEEKEGNEENLRRGNGNAVVDGQTQKYQHDAEGLAVSGSVYSAVKVREAEHADERAAEEDESQPQERSGDDFL